MPWTSWDQKINDFKSKYNTLQRTYNSGIDWMPFRSLARLSLFCFVLLAWRGEARRLNSHCNWAMTSFAIAFQKKSPTHTHARTRSEEKSIAMPIHVSAVANFEIGPLNAMMTRKTEPKKSEAAAILPRYENDDFFFVRNKNARRKS